MRVRVSEKRPWLVHAVAYCQECEWRNESYREARERAYSHAKRTGHYIVVETSYVQHYNERG